MTLNDIFQHLTYGELSQVAQGGASNPVIYEGEAPQMNESQRAQNTGHIELALTALYKRFLLRRKTVTVLLQPGQSVYILDQRFTVSSTTSSELIRYLSDANDPMDAEVMKIEEVHAVGINGLEPFDMPASLNDHTKPGSVLTTGMNILTVPDAFPCETQPTTLRVVYRSAHPKINTDNAVYAPEVEPIELPSTHLQALLYYVASRVMNPVGMVEEFHSGNSYMAKYEAEAKRLEGENMQIEDVSDNPHWERNEFP